MALQLGGSLSDNAATILLNNASSQDLSTLKATLGSVQNFVNRDNQADPGGFTNAKAVASRLEGYIKVEDNKTKQYMKTLGQV